jgi:hypothetical protein
MSLPLVPDDQLMVVAEQQIDWIAEKLQNNRAVGRLALMSVLVGLRDEMQAAFDDRLAAVQRERDEARLEAKAVVVVPFTMRCINCGTAAYQPNPRCEGHISFADRLQTEVEMHNAWRKRADEAEAALAAMTREREAIIASLKADLASDPDGDRSNRARWALGLETTSPAVQAVMGSEPECAANGCQLRNPALLAERQPPR